MKNKSSIYPAKILLVAILFIGSEAAVAQNSSVPEINQKEEHKMVSKINGTVYYLSVSLPIHYSPKDTTHYPVLFVLDGNSTFPIAHATRQGLDFYGELEDVIIVGIGYLYDRSYLPFVTGRWTDYTPSLDPKIDSNPSILKMLDLSNGSLKSGGGSVFIEVIRKEIIPFIDAHYKTTADRGLTGHSYGGLFATYCMLSPTNLFSRFGINSPSLWWNKNEMIELEKTFANQNEKLNAQIFISVGSLEGPKQIIAFADSIRSHDYKGLNVTFQIFDGETHMSVIPSSISRTLRVLYSKKKK